MLILTLITGFVFIFVAVCLINSKRLGLKIIGGLLAIIGIIFFTLLLGSIISKENQKASTQHPFNPSGRHPYYHARSTTQTVSAPALEKEFLSLTVKELWTKPSYWSHKLVSTRGELKGGAGGKIMYLCTDNSQIDWTLESEEDLFKFQKAAEEYMTKNNHYPQLRIKGKVFGKSGTLILVAESAEITD